MKRLFPVSMFALVCVGGVLVGALVSDSESQPEIATLTDEVTRLRMMMERDGRQSDDGAEDREDHEDQEDDEDFEDPEDLDIDERIARERDLVLRRAAAITAAAGREAVDPDWAPAVELQISEGLAANEIPGATLVSAVCKTTLCIAEVEHPPDDDDINYVVWRSVFGPWRSFIVFHDAESGGDARTIAYLARDGHALPRAEPSTAGPTAVDGTEGNRI